MSQQRLNFADPVDHAKRQTELYQGIWAADHGYGTRQADVYDTVAHRILPHVERIEQQYGGNVRRFIDFGAGDGRFLEKIDQLCGRVFYGAGVDVYVPQEIPFPGRWYQQPMWETISEKFDYVVSTDALEHLPPSKVADTLENIAHCAPHGFLRISLIEDRYGTERGLHLHESVFPSIVWRHYIEQAGIKITSYRVYLDDNGERALEVWF